MPFMAVADGVGVNDKGSHLLWDQMEMPLLYIRILLCVI